MESISNRLKNFNIRLRVASLAMVALFFILFNFIISLLTDNLIIEISVIVLVSILGVLYTRVVSLSIRSEIAMFKEIMEEVASGNLTVVITKEMRTKDEFGTFALSVDKTLSQLHMYQDYIDEISRVLQDISTGRMKVDLHQQYGGQFKAIKEAMLQISTSLNQTLTGINDSSELVASQSQRMQIAASKLSDATADQASSVEELNASIQEIRNQVTSSAESAIKAKEKIDKMGETVITSNEKVTELLDAMEQINKSSNDIVNIIQTIEEIANKTNLLSLNASIEAARAGEMGRGFAVVASEIGNLANQSVSAVKMTSELKQRTLEAVKKGVVLADISAKSTKDAEVVAREVKQIMDVITDNSQSQSTLINQFSEAVEQIAEVLDHNQATAIDSAQISEALREEAFTLKERIDQFELY